MGFLKTILRKNKEQTDFIPDSQKTEYENWLDFVSMGGTSAEWERLKAENSRFFKVDSFELYQKEFEKVSKKYFPLMLKIQKDWSALYNLNDYNGKLAEIIEEECLINIKQFQEMFNINAKYNKSSPENVPAFRRLAMLYEKQGRFEEAVKVCKTACVYGMDERSRLIRMIKKAGRMPTDDELLIIEK